MINNYNQLREKIKNKNALRNNIKDILDYSFKLKEAGDEKTYEKLFYFIRFRSDSYHLISNTKNLSYSILEYLERINMLTEDILPENILIKYKENEQKYWIKSHTVEHEKYFNNITTDNLENYNKNKNEFIKQSKSLLINSDKNYMLFNKFNNKLLESVKEKLSLSAYYDNIYKVENIYFLKENFNLFQEYMKTAKPRDKIKYTKDYFLDKLREKNKLIKIDYKNAKMIVKEL